jgi:hypothetical protein
MKRHGNLFEWIADTDNLVAAHEAARRGKKHYAEVRAINADPERWLRPLRETLLAGTYRTSDYVSFTRRESGKERLISKLPYYPDRIAHHAVMQVLGPIWDKQWVRDTYSSIKGRGIHDGVRRMHEFLKDKMGTRYCLKIDVRKFYPSVNGEILKSILARKIKDTRVMALLCEIIDSAAGLPIGNYLSQAFGNLYLGELDRFCKEGLRTRYYARYCDDVVIFGETKEWLRAILGEVANFLAVALELTLKGNWQIFRVKERGVDFLGYRFFGNRTLIRKRIATRFKRRVGELVRRAARGEVAPEKIRATLASYHGWLSHGNGRNLERAMVNKFGLAGVIG